MGKSKDSIQLAKDFFNEFLSKAGPGPSGGQIVIRPGSNDFKKAARQFAHLPKSAIPKTPFVIVVAAIPGWVFSSTFENFWIEMVSILPADKLQVIHSVRNEASLDVIKSKAEEIADYIVRTRVFMVEGTADISSVQGISDENPDQPFLEFEALTEYPYRRKSVKGLADVKPSHWSKVAAKLARGEGLLSRRKIKPGRPTGSGWFSNVSDFDIALRDVLAKCTKRPTELAVLKKVDAHLRCRRQHTAKPLTQNDTKLLRNWIEDAGLGDFETALKKYFYSNKNGK